MDRLHKIKSLCVLLLTLCPVLSGCDGGPARWRVQYRDR